MNTYILLVILLIVIACNENTKKEEIIKIFTQIESDIIANAENLPDSVLVNKAIGHNNRIHFERLHYSDGKLIKKELLPSDSSRVIAIIRYSKDGLFELRNEIGEYGFNRTNGILYNGSFYGPWLVNYDNGQKMYEGFRYEDLDLGKWTHYNITDSTVKKIVDEGNKQFYDSLIHKFGLYPEMNFGVNM